MTGTRLKLFSVSLSLWLLAGCAGVATASDEESVAARDFTPIPDKALVFLYRPSQALGAAIATEIKVNGITAGGTGPGTFFRWEVKPGVYAFSAQTQESFQNVQVNAEAGKLYFLRQTERLGFTTGGRVGLVQVDEATGKKAVGKLKMLYSAYVPES